MNSKLTNSHMVAAYPGVSAEFTNAVVGLVTSVHHADPVAVSMPSNSAHYFSVPLKLLFHRSIFFPTAMSSDYPNQRK